jgi:hypothetical protein
LDADSTSATPRGVNADAALRLVGTTDLSAIYGFDDGLGQILELAAVGKNE